MSIIKSVEMNNSNTSTKICLTAFAAVLLLLTVIAAKAQTDSIKKKRLQNPAAIKSFVGGESHDSYVIRVRKNQILRVQISWHGRGDHRAHFVVSKSADFYAGDLVESGRETYNGKNWTGKVPATGDYYIYVTAHPDARYTLKVSIK